MINDDEKQEVAEAQHGPATGRSKGSHVGCTGPFLSLRLQRFSAQLSTAVAPPSNHHVVRGANELSLC